MDGRAAQPAAIGLLPVMASAIAAIQVGANIVATRFVVDQTGPASLALLRYVIGFCCLLPPALLVGRIRFAGRDLVPIALLGIGQFGILIALLNYGLQSVPAARAALIFATLPLLTMLVAAACGHERITAAKTGGVLLTVAGVAVALGDKAVASGAIDSWVGELAVLASALTGALCSVLYLPYLRRYPTLPISAFAMLASIGFLALIAAGEGFFAAPPRIAMAGWGAIAFIGVSSGVGYYLWLWALGRVAATRVTVFLGLSPLTAAALGAALLGEPFSMLVVIGLVCVAGGLWLAHRPESAAPPQPRCSRRRRSRT